eukprot:2958125-Rhodomonas_salina.1
MRRGSVTYDWPPRFRRERPRSARISWSLSRQTPYGAVSSSLEWGCAPVTDRVHDFRHMAWEALQDPCLIFLCFAAMVSFVVGIIFDEGMEWLEVTSLLSDSAPGPACLPRSQEHSSDTRRGGRRVSRF